MLPAAIDPIILNFLFRRLFNLFVSLDFIAYPSNAALFPAGAHPEAGVRCEEGQGGRQPGGRRHEEPDGAEDEPDAQHDRCEDHGRGDSRLAGEVGERAPDPSREERGRGRDAREGGDGRERRFGEGEQRDERELGLVGLDVLPDPGLPLGAREGAPEAEGRGCPQRRPPLLDHQGRQEASAEARRDPGQGRPLLVDRRGQGGAAAHGPGRAGHRGHPSPAPLPAARGAREHCARELPAGRRRGRAGQAALPRGAEAGGRRRRHGRRGRDDQGGLAVQAGGALVVLRDVCCRVC